MKVLFIMKMKHIFYFQNAFLCRRHSGHLFDESPSYSIKLSKIFSLYIEYRTWWWTVLMLTSCIYALFCTLILSVFHVFPWPFSMLQINDSFISVQLSQRFIQSFLSSFFWGPVEMFKHRKKWIRFERHERTISAIFKV